MHNHRNPNILSARQKKINNQIQFSVCFLNAVFCIDLKHTLSRLIFLTIDITFQRFQFSFQTINFHSPS